MYLSTSQNIKIDPIFQKNVRRMLAFAIFLKDFPRAKTEKIPLHSHLAPIAAASPLHMRPKRGPDNKNRRNFRWEGNAVAKRTHEDEERKKNALVSPAALQSQRSGNYFWLRARHSRSSKAIGQEMERDDRHRHTSIHFQRSCLSSIERDTDAPFNYQIRRNFE